MRNGVAGGGDHGIQAALRFKVGATEHVCLLMVRTQHRERERLAMLREKGHYLIYNVREMTLWEAVSGGWNGDLPRSPGWM